MATNLVTRPGDRTRSGRTSSDRIGALTGVAGVLLLLAALIVEGEVPAAGASTADVVQFYSDNTARLRVAALLGGIAAVLLIWFGGSVYGTLRSAEGEPGRLSILTFGGMVVAAAGFAMLFAFGFAAAQTVGDVPPEVTHTIEVLAALFFLPLVVGFLVALLASGVAILRHGALPAWLGYLSILMVGVFVAAVGLDGVAAIAVWIVGGAAWTAILSVSLFLRARG